MHIVVDGYNFIRQSPELCARERVSLEAGRESLLKQLAEFKAIRPHWITCVFDGKGGLGDRETRQFQGGIEVIYSAVGQTADEVIKKIAHRESANLLVVTSDREIANFVQRRGGAVISSPEFAEQMSMIVSGFSPSAQAEEEKDGRERGTTKKGPSRRLPKNERKLKKSLSKL